jgi:ABC-type nitrate/sulfonate/bicarbonate transport system permease component
MTVHVPYPARLSTSSTTEGAADQAPVARPLQGKSVLRSYLRSRSFGWTVVAAALIAWQVLGTLFEMPELPPLSAIADEWHAQVTEGDLLQALLETLRITAIGFSIATVAGVLVGFLMGRVRVFWGLVEPFVELMRQIPVTALLPLLILYLGIGDRMRITVVVIVASFPILLNSLAGARSMSRTMRMTAQTFRLSWLQTQIEIGIPMALPYILVGMRQALGMTLVMAVVTGMLAGNSGVGYFILQAQQVLNVRALFAGVLTIALVGYTLNAIFLIVERRATRWRSIGAVED